MSGWTDARSVEARGMLTLRPYLLERSTGLVVTSKGVLARHLQLIAGDVFWNDKKERLWCAEIKVEEKHTGNLFLETWSNRNLDDKLRHSSHGSNRGWLDHCRADLLLYYFLDSDDLYAIDLFKLKQWAFASGERNGIYRFSERLQRKNSQLNDTWGRLVPIDLLHKELGAGMKHTSVRQLSLLSEVA